MTIVDHLCAVLAIQNPKHFRSAEDQRVLEEAERALAASNGRCERCEAMHRRAQAAERISAGWLRGERREYLRLIPENRELRDEQASLIAERDEWMRKALATPASASAQEPMDDADQRGDE